MVVWAASSSCSSQPPCSFLMKMCPCFEKKKGINSGRSMLHRTRGWHNVRGCICSLCNIKLTSQKNVRALQQIAALPYFIITALRKCLETAACTTSHVVRSFPPRSTFHINAHYICMNIHVCTSQDAVTQTCRTVSLCAAALFSPASSLSHINTCLLLAYLLQSWMWSSKVITHIVGTD